MKRVSMIFAVAAVALACDRVTFAQPAITNLGTLPGGSSSHAYGVSGDGSVVVGQGHIPAQGYDGWRAFRWTSAGGCRTSAPFRG